MNGDELEKNKEYPPEVLQIAYTRKLAERMAELASLIETTIPEGEKEDVTVSVADEWRTIPGDYPWFSFDLFNDGPDPVYFDVNGHRSLRPNYDTPINSGESVEVDMRANVINSVHVTCDDGGEASVRIQAVR